VKVLGYQDSLYTKGGRSYFSNSTVSGDVDFVFANGTTVFNNSIINLDGDHSGGDITPPAPTSEPATVLFSSTPRHRNSVRESRNRSSKCRERDRTGRQFDVSGPPLGLDPDRRRFQHRLYQYIHDLGDQTAGWLAWDSTETTVTNNKMAETRGRQAASPNTTARICRTIR